MNKNNNLILKNFAITSFSYIAFLFLCTTLCFFLKISISNLHFYLLTALFIILDVIYLKKNNNSIKSIIITNIIVFTNLALSLYICSLIFDSSCDGQIYHQDAIFRLSNGWNPFWNPIVDSPHSIWVSHYGKVSWIIGSIFYKLTGNIESAKSLNLFLILPLISYSFSVLSNLSKNKKLISIISFLIILSPTAITQTFCSYVDGLLYITFTIMLLSIIQILSSDNNKTDHYIILSSSILILSNLKFTGLGYAGLLMVCFVTYKICRDRLTYVKAKPLCIYFISIFIVATFITGFNPYITNMKMGHPFYPLSGPNKIDIITSNTPEFMRNKGPVGKFISANYGVPGKFEEKQLIWQNSPKELKNKFIEGLKISYAYDLAVGGFGPLTPIFITFILISSVYLFFKIDDNNKSIYRFILISILLTVLINPEFWWARYVPQIWTLLCINVFYLFFIKSNKKFNINNILGSLMIILILLSSSITLVRSIHFNINSTKKFKTFYSELAKESNGKVVKVNWGWYTPTQIKFDKNNIKYEVSNIDANTPNVKPIYGTNGFYVIE